MWLVNQGVLEAWAEHEVLVRIVAGFLFAALATGEYVRSPRRTPAPQHLATVDEQIRLAFAVIAGMFWLSALVGWMTTRL